MKLSSNPSFSLYHTNNMVFSLTRKDCGKIINSYPALSWLEETPYKIALAFLNGADTLQKLSEATDTQLSADDYLKHIHNVLGDVSSRITTTFNRASGAGSVRTSNLMD